MGCLKSLSTKRLKYIFQVMDDACLFVDVFVSFNDISKPGLKVRGTFVQIRSMKILMVCKGNICRSPLAEGILKTKAQQKKLNWSLDSAAMGNWHVGKQPHELSQKVALLNGVDI